jgi:hypothetical protein
MTAIEAGWIGCLMSLLGCVAGVGVGAMNDRFAGQTKRWITVSFVLASMGFGVLGVLLLGYWSPASHTFRKRIIFASALWGGTFLNAPIPLFYEMVRCSFCRQGIAAPPPLPAPPSPCAVDIHGVVWIEAQHTCVLLYHASREFTHLPA